MIYKKQTSKPLAQAVEAMQAAVKAHGFGVLHTYDFKQTVVPVFLAAPIAGVVRNVEVLEPARELRTHLASHLWNRNGDRVQRTVDFDTTFGIVALAGAREAVFADLDRSRGQRRKRGSHRATTRRSGLSSSDIISSWKATRPTKTAQPSWR